LGARHNDDLFENAIADRVTEWFGLRRLATPA